MSLGTPLPLDNIHCTVGLITFVFTYVEIKLTPTAFALKLNNKDVTIGCQNSHVATTY